MIEQLTESTRELQALTRRFASERTPLIAVRKRLDEASYDPVVWDLLTTELGLAAIAVPEEFGGLGLGLTELALCAQELGRELYDGPFLSSACLATLALRSVEPDDEVGELLLALAEGQKTATLAWEANVTSRAVDGSHVLDGTSERVIDGATADAVIVVAADQEGSLGLYLLDAASEGVSRSVQPSFDLTRRLSRIEFIGAVGRYLGAAEPALNIALRGSSIVLAGEQLGGAERCLEFTLAYLKQRVQFGRTIGSFQAVKHQAVDVFLDIEKARSALMLALGEAHDETAREAAAIGHLQASRAFSGAAKAAVHLHGGIGFTWEHDAHLYLKRAKSSEVLLRSPEQSFDDIESTLAR